MQDMFHYMDPEYPDSKTGEFESLELAIEAAKSIILNSFEKENHGENDYKKWLMFGENAYIVAKSDCRRVDFSGQQFIKEKCKIK